MLICCGAARESVWVGLPLEGAPPASPVSVTVIVYAAVADCGACAFEAGAGEVNTLMLLTTGGRFCVMYAKLTSSRVALPLRSAFHWIYLALGLATGAGDATGADHSLQVLSGRSDFPERVPNRSPLPWGLPLRRPQRATPPASWPARPEA